MAGRVVPIQLAAPKSGEPASEPVYFELSDVQVVGGNTSRGMTSAAAKWLQSKRREQA